MPPSSIKLWYFDFKGRAEGIRVLLSAAGQPFEDIRFKREDWPKYKPDAPYGQCPYVEIDGQKHAQTLAILQYLAREYGFYGETNKEALMIDQVIHLIQDLVPTAGQIINATDPETKKEHMEKMVTVMLPRVLGHIENILKANGTGYVAGAKLSLADLCVFDLCNCALKPMISPLLTSYPLVAALANTVSENEGIKSYLATRPDSDL